MSSELFLAGTPGPGLKIFRGENLTLGEFTECFGLDPIVNPPKTNWIQDSYFQLVISRILEKPHVRKDVYEDILNNSPPALNFDYYLLPSHAESARDIFPSNFRLWILHLLNTHEVLFEDVSRWIGAIYFDTASLPSRNHVRLYRRNLLYLLEFCGIYRIDRNVLCELGYVMGIVKKGIATHSSGETKNLLKGLKNSPSVYSEANVWFADVIQRLYPEIHSKPTVGYIYENAIVADAWSRGLGLLSPEMASTIVGKGLGIPVD